MALLKGAVVAMICLSFIWALGMAYQIGYQAAL